MAGGSARDGRRLCVFDFDGTLFRSPVPRLERRHENGKAYGELVGGDGWFHTLATLTPPAVPEVPDGSWWVSHIRGSALEALSNPEDNYVVMLTGRSVAFTKRVHALLASGGLDFHEVHLKPHGENTFQWKCGVIEQMYTERACAGLVIYEDRPRHAGRFESHFTGKGWRPRVVRVPEKCVYLPLDVEAQIVADILRSKHAKVVMRVANPLELLPCAGPCRERLQAFIDGHPAADELVIESIPADERKALYFYAQSRDFPFRKHVTIGPIPGREKAGVLLKRFAELPTDAFDAALDTFIDAEGATEKTFAGLDRHARAVLYDAIAAKGLRSTTRRDVGGGKGEATTKQVIVYKHAHGE